MPRTKSEVSTLEPGKSTRRRFLKGAGLLALGAPAIVRARAAAGSSAATELSAARAHQVSRRSVGKPLLAYLGTYSSPQAPEEPGDGEGIYLMEMNPETGLLSEREVFKNDQNPSWVSLDPSGKFLYCCNETDTYQGEKSGSVSAYRVERPSGHLTLINTVPSGGSGPAHLSVHPSGKYVLVANYDGGTVAVLPVQANGELATASFIHHDTGKVGPTHAKSAPRGSFAISGHEAPHAHMIEADPSGGRVVWADLGLDRIFVAEIDLATGKLSPAEPPSAALPPGDGPRHFVFHPNGHWMYSVEEEGSTVTLWDYDAANGELKSRQTLTTLPPGFAGTNFPSEIRISPDARFIYAANRNHDSIAYFSIGDGGRLSYRGEEWTRGDQPRSISLDPSGNFLYSLNQRADVVTVFRLDRDTGRPAFTGQYIAVGSPACLVFLA
jgi:6-phosphogluconolactonase